MKISRRRRARLLVVGGAVLFCGLPVLAVRLAVSVKVKADGPCIATDVPF
ncbi:hypothetical protein [Dactylosporangium sp. NPDC050588]